jgi:hypothetical protein
MPANRAITVRACSHKLLGTATPTIGELAPFGLARRVARELLHFGAIYGISQKFVGDVHRIGRDFSDENPTQDTGRGSGFTQHRRKIGSP